MTSVKDNQANFEFKAASFDEKGLCTIFDASEHIPTENVYTMKRLSGIFALGFIAWSKITD